MSNFVIWIDREHAKIFQISAEKMERKSLRSTHAEHHTHKIDGLDQQHQEKRLFADAALLLKEAQHLLILGPGVAKHHFQNYLLEHHPALAKKISACEAVDHPSDAQIAALARTHFEIAKTILT